MCDVDEVSSETSSIFPADELVLLSDWMRSIELRADGLAVTRRVPGGTQNELWAIQTVDAQYVLRRARRGATDRQNQALMREAKVLQSLRGTAVRHAAYRGGAAPGEVFDSAFILMDYVAGFNAAASLPLFHLTDPTVRRGMAFSAIRALGTVAEIDWRGLEFVRRGEPERFLEGQVDRWRQLMESHREVPGYEAVNLDGFDRLGDWLDRHQPAAVEPGLMHGDFHYGNLLFAEESAEIAAIVDWELATVGAPLLDLGWFLVTTPSTGRETAGHALASAGGLPDPDELVALYHRVTGRSVADIDWFTALAGYKMAAILEGTVARVARGQADPATGKLLHALAVRLIRRGNDIIERVNRGI